MGGGRGWPVSLDIGTVIHIETLSHATHTHTNTLVIGVCVCVCDWVYMCDCLYQCWDLHIVCQRLRRG